jgi:anti-sigma regulatory factor (Ser/Thr protein kinase)
LPSSGKSRNSAPPIGVTVGLASSGTESSRDEGPAFHDLQLALRDGFNDRGPIDSGTLLKRGGFGAGLGAVVRMTDSFRVNLLSCGKEIHVMRFRTRQRSVRKL